MPKLIVMSPGMKFNKLTVIRPGPTIKGKSRSYCRCDCGKEVLVKNSCLKNGHVKSCGCANKDVKRDWSIKHNASKTTLYYKWRSMKKRCFCKTSHNYANYGGRGISVYEEWMDFNNFKKWAYENGFREGLSIDRIDVNGNYEPGNCRWADNVDQGRNRRTNVMLEYNGENKSIADWADFTGLGYTTILERWRAGWDAKRIIETPKRHYTRKQEGTKDRVASFSLFVNPEILATGQQKKMNFRTHRIYTDKRVANGMRLVEIAARPHVRDVLSVCPPGTRVSLEIEFFCLYPKGTPTKDRIEGGIMVGRFDCDNKFKSVGDALTKAGFWPDDRYITSLVVKKRRTISTPRIEICIKPDDGTDIELAATGREEKDIFLKGDPLNTDSLIKMLPDR